MNVGDDPVHAPTKAVATNNQFAESGRMDSNPAHKKTVQGAAKKLEGLLADSSKVSAFVPCTFIASTQLGPLFPTKVRCTSSASC
jgi:hypothetical protein